MWGFGDFGWCLNLVVFGPSIAEEKHRKGDINQTEKLLGLTNAKKNLLKAQSGPY